MEIKAEKDRQLLLNKYSQEKRFNLAREDSSYRKRKEELKTEERKGLITSGIKQKLSIDWSPNHLN